MTPADLARRIVTGLLIPAVEAQDHHERWKRVNRAAGVMAGYALGAGAQAGQSLVLAVTTEFTGKMAAMAPLPAPQQRGFDMIMGPNGLQKRLAECVDAIGSEPGEGE